MGIATTEEEDAMTTKPSQMSLLIDELRAARRRREEQRANGAAVMSKAVELCRAGRISAADVAKLHMRHLYLENQLRLEDQLG